MRTLSAVILGGAVLFTAAQLQPAFAQSGASGGQSGDQPGSGATAIPPGQQPNIPGMGSVERRSMDMTGGKSGLSDHYDVVPVRAGELKDEKGGPLNHEVKNPQGETIGTIQQLLKDMKTGRIEYAVLELADSKYRLPLQWSLFKQQGEKLTINASKEQLRPGVSSDLTKDHSPEISQYMKDINSVREAPKTGGGVGITNQPASAGSMGEENVGGGGPAGTRALPPQGRAPQLEKGDPSSKR